MRNANGFDKIISLGYNCEVSFRIKDYLARDIDSYPFSWIFVKEQQKMPFLLELFMGGEGGQIFDGDLEAHPWNMITFKRIGVSFHTRAADQGALLLPDGSPNMERVNLELQELKSRFSHLSEKFHDIMTNRENVLFIQKIMTDTKENMQNVIVQTDKILQKYKRGCYFSLCLLDKTQSLADF